jgi:REP element-mobilizing transposase RayT
VQVPRRVYAEVSQEAAFRQNKTAPGQVFHDLARPKECRIEEGHLMPDHVHMLISIPPKYSVAQIIVIHEREEFDMDRGRMSNAR